MRLAIIDIAAAYHAETPRERALGGTQNAACHLAAALAAEGVAVTLINQNRMAGVHAGVESLPPEALDDGAALERFDALIFSGRWTEKLVRALRKKTAAPFIGWMHEASFNDPWIMPLPLFSAFVFVSAWQQRLNAPLIPSRTQSVVMGNGIAPVFETTPLPDKPFSFHAVYVGSSKRGLFFLPEIIAAVRARYPTFTCSIFSDCVVSTDEAENEKSRRFYAALPGVIHVGAVAPHLLAQRLQEASFFISPNPYPETFCISLAEAMAAGLSCITTARAALPETGAGFTRLVGVKNPDAPFYDPDGVDVPRFTEALCATLEEKKNESAETRHARRAAQSLYARTHYGWPHMAGIWKKQLKRLLAGGEGRR